MNASFDDIDQTLAMVFPGQGSQSVGMLSSLARTFPQVVKAYQEAGEVLGYDLWRLVMEGPEAELNRTFPPASETFRAIERACHAAITAGWMCAQGNAQRKFGRIFEPSDALADSMKDPFSSTRILRRGWYSS